MMDDQNKENKQQDNLVELGMEVSKSAKGNIYTLTIIGQIEGHQVLPETVKTTKYEHILPLLAGIEESDEIDGILLLLNTVGGDIEAGLAIAEMISGMKKPTVSLVLGGGHSIGIPLAVCAKKSGADDRIGSGCATNLSVFSPDSRTDHRFCHCKFCHYKRNL